jgi:N-acetylglutamate synthase-like GNAT family acetyltransferase
MDHESRLPVTVRRATAADAAGMAALSWHHLVEEHGYAGTDLDVYVELFTTWLSEHQATHVPFLAEVGDQIVAMASLMVAARVPTPARRNRRFGDVQSVLVAAELRNSGVGAALLHEVLAEARRLDLEHVTVHSSRRAVPFYERAGFETGPQWLRWKP